MGMLTIIYGYIEEMDFGISPFRDDVRKHNSSVIHSLPSPDNWPPLSPEMFAITGNNPHTHPHPFTNLEYCGRIIHFGASLKSVEYEWAEWKAKFEKLLASLYFIRARVHIKTEYMELETACWEVDLHKYREYEAGHGDKMPPLVRLEDCEYDPSAFDTMFPSRKS